MPKYLTLFTETAYKKILLADLNNYIGYQISSAVCVIYKTVKSCVAGKADIEVTSLCDCTRTRWLRQ